MERKIEQFLRKWKKDKTGKPLMIYGSKQVGKTFIVYLEDLGWKFIQKVPILLVFVYIL